MTDVARYAVVKSGSRQYRVSAGSKILVNKVDGQVGQSLTLDKIMMVGGAGVAVKIGAPFVDGATVNAKIVGHERGRKVVIFKKHRTHGFTKKQGHRQELTRLAIEEINA